MKEHIMMWEMKRFRLILLDFAIAPYAHYSFYENKIVRLFIDMEIMGSTHQNLSMEIL